MTRRQTPPRLITLSDVTSTLRPDPTWRKAKGHGVHEVMAVYYKGGVIRPVVALVKSLAFAIAIGSGSSVGLSVG